MLYKTDGNEGGCQDNIKIQTVYRYVWHSKWFLGYIYSTWSAHWQSASLWNFYGSYKKKSLKPSISIHTLVHLIGTEIHESS